ncbi:MAG: NTP transferase domain-containing protein [Bacteroidetes bacterium]|nr:NTP transferase domain-containing protein [Bacteroidota bacterium]
MKLIIIAAGKGSRIQSLSNGIPKTLLRINDKCMIDYIIDNCKEVGIKECVVVTGYRKELLSNYLKRVQKDISIEVVYNPDWELPNGISVLAAKSAIPVGDNFLVTMSDHLYESSLLRKIKECQLNKMTVKVGLDFNIDRIFDINDGMKVKVDPSDPKAITAMSKNLNDFDAIDCGLFKCKYEFFNVLEQAKEKGIYYLSDACNILINSRNLGGIDINNNFWIDIDTEEAFKYVQQNKFSIIG